MDDWNPTPQTRREPNDYQITCRTSLWRHTNSWRRTGVTQNGGKLALARLPPHLLCTLLTLTMANDGLRPKTYSPQGTLLQQSHNRGIYLYASILFLCFGNLELVICRGASVGSITGGVCGWVMGCIQRWRWVRVSGARVENGRLSRAHSTAFCQYIRMASRSVYLDEVGIVMSLLSN